MTNSNNVDTWNPEQAPSENDVYIIEDRFLQRIINFMLAHNTSDIHSFLDQKEQEQHAPIMKQPKEFWLTTASERLSEESIISLIKFFTLAEMQYPQWRADELSPVIGLTKGLKRKGGKIDRELLTWIKTENDNKFLPNGPL